MTNQITTLSREDLVERISQLQNDNDNGWTADAYFLKVCRALLAVMDAKPTCWEIAGQIFSTEEEALKPGYVGRPEPLYETPPLPSVPDGWIKCSDRMPAIKDFLWVYDGVEPVRAYYYESGNIFIRDNGDELYRVTHWMPLPAAPGGEL